MTSGCRTSEWESRPSSSYARACTNSPAPDHSISEMHTSAEVCGYHPSQSGNTWQLPISCKPVRDWEMNFWSSACPGSPSFQYCDIPKGGCQNPSPWNYCRISEMGFPKCVGAICGALCQLKGISECMNQKAYYSLVLQGLVDTRVSSWMCMLVTGNGPWYQDI